MKRILPRLLPLLLAADILMVILLHAGGAAWPGILSAVAYSVFGVDTSGYTVRGVDVSEYQGNIDWDVLAAQDLSFAYIKATRGSGYRDKKFGYNWTNAKKTGLHIGAYHLFTFDEPASRQAENFIGSVPKEESGLPPAVDIELYGEQREDPPDKQKAVAALKELLRMLEDYYEKKPVIYVTKKSFNLYIKGGFEGYPLWVRNVNEEPALPDGRDWKFWQFSNRGVLKGYEGEETFIDLNVFKGTKEDLERFAGGT